MADTEHSKCFARKGVRVQVPPSAPRFRLLICGNMPGSVASGRLALRTRRVRLFSLLYGPIGVVVQAAMGRVPRWVLGGAEGLAYQRWVARHITTSGRTAVHRPLAPRCRWAPC